MNSRSSKKKKRISNCFSTFQSIWLICFERFLLIALSVVFTWNMNVFKVHDYYYSSHIIFYSLTQCTSWCDVCLHIWSSTLHEVSRCFLSIFWWLSFDYLCSMWCVHHVLVSRSFYALHALSLQFSSLMFETFLKLLKLLNSSCEVQYLHFQAYKATLLNFVASLIHLWFLERFDQLISFISFSFHFFSLFSLKSYIFCKVITDYFWVAASLLLLFFLLRQLMMMFQIWNMYFLMFVIIY